MLDAGGRVGFAPTRDCALQALLVGNADYLVDELCAQLRAVDRTPGAAALFAAILRCSGAPPVLLPLLAEPARLAVRSLAITARSACCPCTA